MTQQEKKVVHVSEGSEYSSDDGEQLYSKTANKYATFTLGLLASFALFSVCYLVCTTSVSKFDEGIDGMFSSTFVDGQDPVIQACMRKTIEQVYKNRNRKLIVEPEGYYGQKFLSLIQSSYGADSELHAVLVSGLSGWSHRLNNKYDQTPWMPKMNNHNLYMAWYHGEARTQENLLKTSGLLSYWDKQFVEAAMGGADAFGPGKRPADYIGWWLQPAQVSDLSDAQLTMWNSKKMGANIMQPPRDGYRPNRNDIFGPVNNNVLVQ